MSLAEQCQRGDHSSCPIRQSQNHEFPNCQCDCHPGTVPTTMVEGQMVNKT